MNVNETVPMLRSTLWDITITMALPVMAIYFDAAYVPVTEDFEYGE